MKVDVNEIPDTVPTICVPHMLQTITVPDIQKAFNEKLNLGKITYIRIVERDTYSCAFIHLVWNDDEQSQKIRKRLMKGKSIRFLYGEDLATIPWFWKCVATENSIKNYQKLE
jgi:hypothetical protein